MVPPRGALLPFGGHKGYGLAMPIDALLGTYSLREPAQTGPRGWPVSLSYPLFVTQSVY